LLKEHQFHMATMGDIFQKEMDLIEVAKKDPNVRRSAVSTPFKPLFCLPSV
jgi:hypothetical protein